MARHEITCPHCKAEVEVDITSATESFSCPSCGASVALEVTRGQKRARRTMIVVPSVDPMEQLRVAPDVDPHAPKVLDGDPHERLLFDPEVRQNLKRLKWGAATLAGVIALLCAADYLHWWAALAPSPPARDTTHAPPASKRKPGVKPDAPPATPVDVRDVLTRSPLAPTVPPVAPQPKPAPASPAAPEANAKPKPRSEPERALDALRAFLEATNVDQRLKFVRDVDAMQDTIRAYYATHPDGPIPYLRVRQQPGAAATSHHQRFLVEMRDGTTRLATLGPVRSGDYRVDWASFVIYSAMDWDEFLAKRPTAPVFMRVLLQSASEPADPTGDFLVKITNPLAPDSTPLLGYADRQSSAGKSLNLVLQTAAGVPVQAMVTLKFSIHDQPIAQQHLRVIVDKLIGEGWITP